MRLQFPPSEDWGIIYVKKIIPGKRTIKVKLQVYAEGIFTEFIVNVGDNLFEVTKGNLFFMHGFVLHEINWKLKTISFGNKLTLKQGQKIRYVSDTVPDVYAIVRDRCNLTRRTIKEMIEKRGGVKDVIKNPSLFIYKLCSYSRRFQAEAL